LPLREVTLRGTVTQGGSMLTKEDWLWVRLLHDIPTITSVRWLTMLSFAYPLPPAIWWMAACGNSTRRHTLLRLEVEQRAGRLHVARH
jgi:hypothetical protein